MKWIATILAVIVLSVPLGFADNGNEGAKSVTAMSLRFRQIGEAFGDFSFGVRSFLAFDDNTKVELIKERNELLNERQEVWIAAKSEALDSLDSNLTIEEKNEIRNMVRAEHESIVKEHLQITSRLREIQLKARSEARADLESEAKSALESGSNLSLGLFRTEINGRGSRAVLIGKMDGSKIEVKGNIVLDNETKSAINQLISSISDNQSVKIEVKIAQKNGEVKAERRIDGNLTAIQQSLLSDLEVKAKALVGASNDDAKLELRIRHRANAQTQIDTAQEAQEIVERRLGVEASNVTARVQNGVEVFVVTGAETRTSGNFNMTKSFEAVIESGTGLILSADMSARFEQSANATVSGSRIEIEVETETESGRENAVSASVVADQLNIQGITHVGLEI